MNTENEPAQDEAPEAPQRFERKPTPSPFDHPLSFPLLLFALGCWFGWDGWFNPKTKAVMFNRIMFGVFSVGFVWTLRIGLLEMRDNKKEADRQA